MARRVMMAILIAALLGAGGLAAWAESDIYVVVGGDAAQFAAQTAAYFLPLGSTAVFLYTTQESLLDTLNSLAGTSIDNYYIWVCVDTACVPVDPYTVGN